MTLVYNDIKDKSPEIGQKIYGIIRHFNPKYPEQEQALTQAEDGFYVDDGPEELSCNWSVIAWRERK